MPAPAACPPPPAPAGEAPVIFNSTTSILPASRGRRGGLSRELGWGGTDRNALAGFLAKPSCCGFAKPQNHGGERGGGGKQGWEVKQFVQHPRKTLERVAGDLPGRGTGQASHEPAFEAISRRRHGKKPGAYASCQPGRWAPGFSRVVTAANCPGTVSNET